MVICTAIGKIFDIERVSLDVGNPLQQIQYTVMFEKLASSGQQIPAYLRLPY